MIHTLYTQDVIWVSDNLLFRKFIIKLQVWKQKLRQNYFLQISSVQSLSRVWLFATPWMAECQVSLSITNSRSLLNSCPSSQWYHPTISSSVVPFSSCFLHLLAIKKLTSFEKYILVWLKCVCILIHFPMCY